MITKIRNPKSEARNESHFEFRTSYFVLPAKRGFTLIETMVAITILTLSIAGPLFVANRSIVAAQIARSQLTASYLAQEAIEYVRSMRDNEYLAAVALEEPNVSTVAWNNFLTSGSGDDFSITACRASACTLDPTEAMGTASGSSLDPCSGSSCTPLYLLDNGVYSQRTDLDGQVTPYTRTVQVLDIAGTTDISGAPHPDKRLVATVSWDFHGRTYSVTVTDHLTPWQ